MKIPPGTFNIFVPMANLESLLGEKWNTHKGENVLWPSRFQLGRFGVISSANFRGQASQNRGGGCTASKTWIFPNDLYLLAI